jgi:hypothetical protein
MTWSAMDLASIICTAKLPYSHSIVPGGLEVMS